MTDKTIKQHFFMITGNVIYQPLAAANEPDNPMGAMALNAVIKSDTTTFPVSSIARAQQNLQHHFYQKTQDNALKIVDVILTNVCYLGHMTDEEFHAAPAGTAKQEIPQTVQ